jgi:hypothetical protein
MVKRIERFIAASKNLPARRHGPQQMVSLFDHLVGAEQNDWGTSKPSALAVLRFRMNWNFDTRSIGRSAGLVSLRILSTKKAARRKTAVSAPGPCDFFRTNREKSSPCRQRHNRS